MSLCWVFTDVFSAAAAAAVGYVRLSPPNGEVVASLGSLISSVVLLESGEGEQAADGAVCSDLRHLFDCLSRSLLLLWKNPFGFPCLVRGIRTGRSINATAGTAVEFWSSLKYLAHRCGFSPFPPDL